MAKFILLVAVIAGLVLLYKNYQRSIARQEREDREADAAPLPEDMVRCAKCGVHLPKSESFLSDGRYFCSDEHRRIGASGKHGR